MTATCDREVCCPRCGGSGSVMENSIPLGERIRLKRELAGLTQQELADGAGLSRTQITNIEADRSSIPIKRLRTFAALLQCSVEEIIP